MNPNQILPGATVDQLTGAPGRLFRDEGTIFCLPWRFVVVILGSALSLVGQAADSPPARSIFFPPGSAVIGRANILQLGEHARFLQAHADQRLLLEGHTDERGAAEFNLSIGSLRAERVKKALILLGAPSRQIETVSCGEEMPRDRRHNVAAWQFNRRVVLIYGGVDACASGYD